jgi:hypothetical protein
MPPPMSPVALGPHTQLGGEGLSLHRCGFSGAGLIGDGIGDHDSTRDQGARDRGAKRHQGLAAGSFSRHLQHSSQAFSPGSMQRSATLDQVVKEDL